MSPTEAMVQEILERSVRAGRDKLGHLAYQMARTCLSKAESESAHLIRWVEGLSDVIDLGRDMQRMELRIGVDVDRSGLPIATPSSESAVAATRACLRVAEAIEGSTVRVQHVRALVAQTVGDLDASAELFTKLLALPLPQSWRDDVHENRQATFLRAGRYQEALDAAEAVLCKAPGRLSTLFNVATAHAWMNCERGFDQSCEQFRCSGESVSDRGWWARLLDLEATWFAERLGRDPLDIKSSFAFSKAAGDGA